MLKRAFHFLPIVMLFAVSACGGGSGTSVKGAIPGTNNGPSPQSMVSNDLFDLDGSQVLDVLENDAGFTATSGVARTSESAVTKSPAVTGSFDFQMTGGTATVARNANAWTKAIGYLSTFRDATGFCECSNDNATLPAPYKTNIQNPQWIGGKAYQTVSSTTTLGIAMAASGDSSDHGGTYTATIVPKNPGGQTTFGIANNQTYLPRQSPAAVTFAGNALNNCPAGSAYVSWTPAAGTVEFFVAFLTHLNNDPVHHPGFNTVGFVVTDRNYTCVPGSEFYPKATYQVLVVGADERYIGVYDSQGKTQLPGLPGQINFTISQILVLTTP